MTKCPTPRVFYRGTQPGSTKKISTGDAYWDNHLFISSNESLAQSYGSHIEIFDARPEAKILYECQPAFRRLAGRQRRESLLEFVSSALRKAEAAGYDAVHYNRQGDVGTVVINPGAFVKRS